MIEKTIFQETCFWDFLGFIQEHKIKRVTLEELKSKLGLNEDQLIRIVSFCHKLNYPIQIDRDILGRAYIVVGEHLNKVTLNFSIHEWIALQAQIYHQSSTQLNVCTAPVFQKTVEEKVKQALGTYGPYNLFHVIEEERQRQNIFSEINSEDLDHIEKLEQAISSELCLDIEFNQLPRIDFFPLKIVIIDGFLSAVGEDRKENCLSYIDISQISSIKIPINKNYQTKYTRMEVEDFIKALRNVMGTEERLVLKLKSQNEIDLNPHFQHLRNPFITSNMDGEIIWAASVERSEHLYAWLYEMRDSIEILDPQKIAKDFEQYVLMRDSLPRAV